jgi:hypothetical protein
MKYFLSFALLLSLNATRAQSTEDSVKDAVNRLFTAMITADPVLLQSVFADSAVLQTIVTAKDGGISVRNERVQDFVDAIAKRNKGDLDERIRFDVIKIDGPLAIVWAPYAFYLKGVKHHCGTDSFQLLRVAGGWKIQYLIDTRRTCD